MKSKEKQSKSEVKMQKSAVNKPGNRRTIKEVKTLLNKRMRNAQTRKYKAQKTKPNIKRNKMKNNGEMLSHGLDDLNTEHDEEQLHMNGSHESPAFMSEPEDKQDHVETEKVLSLVKSCLSCVIKSSLLICTIIARNSLLTQKMAQGYCTCQPLSQSFTKFPQATTKLRPPYLGILPGLHKPIFTDPICGRRWPLWS